MTERESDIKFEGVTAYVIVVDKAFEVRINANTHSVCVGKAKTLDAAIRAAKALDLYSRNAKRFAGVL